MSGTMQSSTGRQVVADHVIGYGDKGEHVLEYQGEFFYENGEVLKDPEVVAKLPEPFKTQAAAFVGKQSKEKDAKTAVTQPPPPHAVPTPPHAAQHPAPEKRG